MKKFFALILALVMIVAMAVPVMAADTHTITIEGPVSDTVHTYQAYQIFKGDLSEDKTILSNIEWGTGISDGTLLLAALKEETYFGEGAANEFSACTDAEGVAKVLAGHSPDSAKLDKFAEVVGKFLSTTCVESVKSTTDNTYTISGLTDGYYLIKDKDGTLEGAVSDSYTKFMIHVVRDQSVKHKGDVPTVSKEVSDEKTTGYAKYEDAGIGDTVYYKLTGTLPSNYKDYETYKYEFHDTLSAGLTFNKIEEVYIHHADTTTTTTTDAYTVSNVGQKVEVKFDDLKKVTALGSDQIVVIYSAIVNENAVIGSAGNENTVYLKFNNDPNGEGEGQTPEDETIVFAFELDVYKVDGADTTKMLPGAEFIMFVYGHDQEGKEVEVYAQVTDGKLSGWTTDVTQATTLVSDANGKIVIKGVDARTYQLRETKAPDGYNLLEDDIVVTIHATYKNDKLDSLSITVDGKVQQGNASTGIVQTGILNNKGNTLPSTGGMGTTMFYTVGGLMVAAALILLVTKKRMSAEV